MTALAIAVVLAVTGVAGFLWLHSKGAFQSRGESIDPPSFRERSFDQRLWRTTDPYVPGGRYDLRGTMLDDLVHRIRPGWTVPTATSLLGPADQRWNQTRFWLTGGYHRLDESCFAITADPQGRIARVAIVDIVHEPGGQIDELCRHGVQLRRTAH